MSSLKNNSEITNLSDILFYCGTFNPIHYGHIKIATNIKEKLGCKKIIFVPAKKPYHKLQKYNISFSDRVNMLNLALSERNDCEVSDIDNRANADNSYSYNTVTKFIDEFYSDKDVKNNEKLYFLIGADAFKNLSSWYKIDELIKKVKFIIVSRPGEDLPKLLAEKLSKLYSQLDYEVFEENFDISSTEIRKSMSEDKKSDFIPENVQKYILEHNLY